MPLSQPSIASLAIEASDDGTTVQLCAVTVDFETIPIATFHSDAAVDLFTQAVAMNWRVAHAIGLSGI